MNEQTATEEINAQAEAPVKVSYVCPNAPGFFFRIDKTKLRFFEGVLVLEDLNLIKALDELIVKNPDFRQRVKKVDQDAALKLMRAHQAERGGAAKGGLTSQNHASSHKLPVTSGDAAMSNLSPEQQADLIDATQADSGLNLTNIPAEAKTSPLAQLNLKKNS